MLCSYFLLNLYFDIFILLDLGLKFEKRRQTSFLFYYGFFHYYKFFVSFALYSNLFL
jgi:hypothetical protein